MRFGEANLHNCEVMLRDVNDSKKLNTKINQTIGRAGEEKGDPPAYDLSTTIVSSHYWPSFVQGDVNHHPRIQKELTRFADGYKVIIDNVLAVCVRIKNPPQLFP